MANKEIVLPSGATVTLRDPKQLRQGDRKKIYEAIGDGNGSLREGISLIDSLITVMVESWTLDLLPPNVRAESLDELSVEDYDVLQEEGEAIMPLLFPKLNKTVEAELDPKVITENFNA